MDTDTQEALAAAANLLIRSPNAKHLLDAVDTCAPLLAQYKELMFIGEASELYTLARMKVSRPKVYEGVLRLVEQRRQAEGVEPLGTAKDHDKFDRNQYMQEFMLQKRARERRAADLENMRRPERDRLVGRSRLDFMQRVARDWKTELDALKARVVAAHNGKVKRENMQQVSTQFWESVDSRLDAEEDALRRGARAANITAAELNAALSFDPYAK